MAAPLYQILLGSTLELPRCPHCSIDRPNLMQAWSQTRAGGSNQANRQWAVYFCARCGGGVLAYAWNQPGQSWVCEYYPGVEIVDPSIPERPRVLLTQAIEAKHAPAASLMACARSVEEMLMAKGHTAGHLYSKINAAENNHDITPEMARWSHQIRLVANDERHPDILDPLATPDDAQKSIDFALALAEYMFVLPNKIPASTQSRQVS